MRYKYIREKLDGTFTYPPEPIIINSREDLQKWFEWTSQFEAYDDYRSLIGKLKVPYTSNLIKNTETNSIITDISILFPRCKYITHANFFGMECFSITIN